MKKQICFILFLVLGCISVSQAQEVDYLGFRFQLNEADTTATFIRFIEMPDSNLVIPGLVPYNGVDYTLTAIGDNLSKAHDFVGDALITSLSLPSSIKRIGDSFLSVNVTTASGKPQEERGIPADEVGVILFLLKGEFSLPPSLEYLGDFNFYVLPYVSSVSMPASLTHIGVGCFQNCRMLERFKVDTANPVYSASEDGHCLLTKEGKELQMVTYLLPEPEYTLPEGITSISMRIHQESEYSQSSLRFPSTLEKLNSGSLSYLSQSELNLSNTQLKMIPSDCFSNTDFSKVLLPATMDSLGRLFLFHAYYNGSSDTMVCYASSPPAAERKNEQNIEATLLVPQGSVEAYKSSPYWKDFSVIKPLLTTGKEEIEDDEFSVNRSDNGVIVSGLSYSSSLSVYLLTGELLLEKEHCSSVEYLVLSKGLYLIKTDKRVQKVKI